MKLNKIFNDLFFGKLLPTKYKVFLTISAITYFGAFVCAFLFGYSIGRLFNEYEKAILLVWIFCYLGNNYFINEVKDWSKNRK
jgi:hypothetical protein